MINLSRLILIFLLSLIGSCSTKNTASEPPADKIFINSVRTDALTAKQQQLGGCTEAKLTINGTQYGSASGECLGGGSDLVWISSEFAPVEGRQNITVQFVNSKLGYSVEGIWVINQTLPVNTPQVSKVELKGNVTVADPTTTPATPTTVHKSAKAEDESGMESTPSPDAKKSIITAVLQNGTVTVTITWIRIKPDDTKVTTVKKNGGAVAVAIIEGIALICILAWFGYRVMVARGLKNTHSMNHDYSYDNTTGNIVRMSDIPPPREPPHVGVAASSNISTPYLNTNPTSTINRGAPMTSPDLVVPTPLANTRPTTNQQQQQQHNDPFDTLDSW